MKPSIVAAIQKVAPLAGRYAGVVAAQVAAFMAVQVVQSLRTRGVNLPQGAEKVAAAGAAALAARGMSAAGSAAQAIYDHTGVAVEVGWDHSHPDKPVAYRPYTPPAEPATATFEPPAGPQSTLLRRWANGQVPDDGVMPPFPRC